MAKNSQHVRQCAGRWALPDSCPQEANEGPLQGRPTGESGNKCRFPRKKLDEPLIRSDSSMEAEMWSLKAECRDQRGMAGRWHGERKSKVP